MRSQIVEEASQVLSRPIVSLEAFLGVIEKTMTEMLLEAYALGDRSCWPHLFLLSDANCLTYLRLELGPQHGYHDRMARTIEHLARERSARFYGFVQEYALSATILEHNGLLIQAGAINGALPVSTRQPLAKTYWVLENGAVHGAGLSVDEFNEMVSLHKRSPLKNSTRH